MHTAWSEATCWKAVLPVTQGAAWVRVRSRKGRAELAAPWREQDRGLGAINRSRREVCPCELTQSMPRTVLGCLLPRWEISPWHRLARGAGPVVVRRPPGFPDRLASSCTGQSLRALSRWRKLRAPSQRGFLKGPARSCLRFMHTTLQPPGATVSRTSQKRLQISGCLRTFSTCLSPRSIWWTLTLCSQSTPNPVLTHLCKAVVQGCSLQHYL